MATRRTKVFISGASGFIGSAVVDRLSRKKRFALFALTRARRGALPAGVARVMGDMLHPHSYTQALRNADVFVHLASEVDINGSLNEPRKRIERNLEMLFNALECLRTAEHKPLIVFASTDRVYGATDKKMVTEDERPVPLEPYTASKLLCETILETYHRVYGIPYLTLRLSSVYGPHQPRSMFISDIIHKMAAHDSITVGNISTWKNFVYVGDVAYAIEKAAGAPAKARNTVYNIGGQSAPMQSVLTKIRRIMEQRKQGRISITRRNDARPSAVEVRRFILSTKKAQHALDWRPKQSLEGGLAQTVEYLLRS